MDRAESILSQCVRDLLARKADLERAFDRQRRRQPPRINSHAYYAYTNVIRALADIARALPPKETDPEEIRRRARQILETEYGIKRG